MTMRKLFALLPLILLLACEGEPVRILENPVFINGGYSEPGQPGVVLLVHDYGSMCTGTLIAPKIVVTAKHCVRNLDNGFNYPASGFRVYVGPSMYNTVHNVRGASVRTYPGNGIEDQDIALLTLQSEIPASIATPYGYVVSATEDHALVMNQTQLTIIGYGESICGQTNNAGVKLRTEDTFIGFYNLNGDFATKGRGANSGDSGGPVFTQDMKLIGVTSRGADICTGEWAGITIAAFIPQHLAMIREVMEASGYCAPTANRDVCGNGLDDDCNGYVDDGCIAENDPCNHDWECENGICLEQGGQKRCIKNCDIMQFANSCGSGFYCRALECGQAICAPGSPGMRGYLEVCNSDTECENSFCRLAGDGVKRCLTHCTPGQDQCLGNEVCLATAQGCGACSPSHMAPYTGRKTGEPCDSAGQCSSGTCFVWGTSGYCTVGCSSTEPCNAGYHCVNGICVRGELGQAGDPCITIANCRAGLECADFGGGFSHCSLPCTAGEGCAEEGTLCSRALNGVYYCKQGGGRAIGDFCSSENPCGNGLSCQDAGDKDYRCVSRCHRMNPVCPAFTSCLESGQIYCMPMDSGKKSKSSSGGCHTAAGLNVRGQLPLLVLFGLFVFLHRRRRKTL